MAVKRSLQGKPVENQPQALTTYELCAKFHKLPSEVDAEDAKDIQEMLIVMNAIAEEEAKQDKKSNRENLKSKYKGHGPR